MVLIFRLKARILQQASGELDFYAYLAAMKERITGKMESDDWLIDLSLRALLGERDAVLFALNEIEKFMREHPYSGSVPAAYIGLDVAGALFQEWIGYGPVWAWFSDRAWANSAKLQIVGTQCFASVNGEYTPYPHRFASFERVEQLRRTLIRHDPKVRLDAQNPSAELKIDDPLWPGRFLRVAVWVPPRVWDGFTTITFRRQIVEHMTLDDQAGTGLIPHEAVPMLRALALTFPNMVISGPVESGKTTFANTLVGELLAGAQTALGVVMVEKHPESTLPLVVQGHRFIPIRASEKELLDVGIQSLRHDPDVVFMTEMRWSEWLFYCYAGEKGHRGLIGTYHTKEAEDIPYQGAFAVYTEAGGSLRGHLVSTLKSCEVVAVLEPLRNGRKKLVRLCEICYDDDAGRVYAHDWMRWDPSAKEWRYSAGVSEKLYRRMQFANEHAARVFVSELEKLAAKRPLDDPVTESYKSNAVLRGS